MCSLQETLETRGLLCEGVLRTIFKYKTNSQFMIMTLGQKKLMGNSAQTSIDLALGHDVWCIGSGRNACEVIGAIAKGEYWKNRLIVPGLPGSMREAKKYGFKTGIREDLIGTDYIYIDGADQVVINKNSKQYKAVIKGGPKPPPHGDDPFLSGCTYWEKKLARGATEFIAAVDKSKIVKKLGEKNYPVGVVYKPLFEKYILQIFQSIFENSSVKRRVKSNGEIFVTTENMYIADISPFDSEKESLVILERKVNEIEGIESFGLFAEEGSRPTTIVVARQNETSIY